MHDLDDIRIGDLRRFAKVVQTGSFTAAGHQLGESAKQVSRRVAQLEQALDQRLLHRTTRVVRPTSEGLVLQTAVNEALTALESATEQIHHGDGLSGPVHVQTLTLLVESLVPHVGRLLAEHPEVEVCLRVGDRVDHLVAEGLDIAIVGAPPAQADTLVRRLGSVAPSLWAHQDYLAKHGVPEQPSDLAHHHALRFRSDVAQTLWELVHDDGRQASVTVGGTFQCDDSRALLHALTCGLGIGPVASRQGSPGLQRVLPGWGMAGMDLYLAIAPGRQRIARVRAVADLLTDAMHDVVGPI